MEKKVVLKRKVKIISILLLILIAFLVFFLIKILFGIKIKNIFIEGNNNINDEYIIEKAGLKNYPSYFKSLTFSITKKLENDPLIKKATVRKQFYGVVNINIEENKVLFYKEIDNKYVLEDGEEVDTVPYDITPIRVVNFIPETVFENFIKKLSKLSDEVRSKISEIKYDPSEYDDSRFMLYMVDGNYVYATITKFDSINRNIPLVSKTSVK